MTKALIKKLQNDHYYAILDWRQKKREFRAALNKILLFRQRMDDFLESTGHDDLRAEDLHKRFGGHRSISKVLEEMNQTFPTKPEYVGVPSDEMLHQVVLQSLFIASNHSSYLKVPPDKICSSHI